MNNLTICKIIKRHLVLLLISIISFGFSIHVKAQDNQHDFHPNKLAESILSSPEVSSLGNYGNINGNKYNGTINLSIPIYNLNFDGITLPIQISYDSKGVRPTQDASWVGLNWNLSTYFAINRTINGSDDLRGQTTSRGFLYNNFNVQEPQGASPYIPYFNIFALHTNLDGSGSSFMPIDMEPDLFELNLLGKTYQFRLKKKQANNTIETLVFNDNNVKIKFNLANKSFSVVDDKGFKFIFSTKEINTSFSTIPNATSGTTRPSNDFEALMGIFGDNNRKEESIITSWLLSSIESPYGRKIFFKYKEGLHFSYPRYSEYQEVNDQEHIHSDGGGITSSTIYVHATTTVIENQYLESIRGDFGKIEFNHAPRLDLVTPLAFSKMTNNSNIFLVTAKGEIRSHPAIPSTRKPLRLNNIKVKNSNNKVVNDIAFDYSYFNENKINNTHKEKYLRLKLDGLTINDKHYNFEYISPSALPAKDTKDVDFWGFYNGANNSERIPSIGRFVTASYFTSTYNKVVGQAYVDYTMANRSAAFAYGKIGILNKVKYPTGGYSQFEYEGHEALIKVTQPYKITEHLSNGRYRWTDLIDEEKYNFTYQYLKKAKDPSYRLIDQVDQGSNGAFEEVNISTNTEFTITEPTSFKASSSRKCHHNCDNIGFYSSYPMRSILNVATGEEQILFNYGISSVDVQKTLSPGAYKVITNPLPYSPQNPGWPSIEVINEQNSYKIYVPKGGDSTTPPRLYEPFEIGGLRVKSITNYVEDNSISNKKVFEYNVVNAFNESETTGILMDELLYFSKAYGFTSYDPRLWGGGGRSPLKLESESTLRTLPSAQGSHIGYSVVYEKDIDPSGNTNGGIETKFINNPNEYHKISFCRAFYDSNDISGHNPPEVCIENTYILGVAPKSSFGYINGNTAEEIIYNQQKEILRRTKNKYKTLYGIERDRNFARVMPIYYRGTPPVGFGADNVTYFTYRFPHHYALKSVVEESISKEYLNTSISSKQLSVFNDTTHHLKSSKTESSNNQEIETRYYYPYDSNISNLPNMNKLRQANRISTVIKSEVYNNNVILSSKVTNYAVRILNPNFKMLPTSVDVGKGVITNSNPLQREIEFEKYDDKGNILQYKEVDGLTTAYIWGHNKMYPLAKIENATFAESASALGISENALMNFNSLSTLSTLREKLPQAMVTTYTHEPLIGMTSMTDPKGYTTYYEYDGFNRLIHEKDAEENITNKFYYGYADSTSSSNGYDPLTISFKNFPEFASTFKETGFHALIRGGSGNYTYKWEFETSDGKITTIENKLSYYLHFQPHQAGYTTVRFKVTDKVTGEKKMITKGLTAYNVDIQFPRTVKVNNTASFNATISGGSGNYSYKWLVYGQDANYTPTTKSFNLKMGYNYYGVDKYVECKITDNVKGHTITVYKKITVNGAKLGQSWIKTYSQVNTGYHNEKFRVSGTQGSGRYSYFWTSSDGRTSRGTEFSVYMDRCREIQEIRCRVTDKMTRLTYTLKREFYFFPSRCNNNGGGGLGDPDDPTYPVPEAGGGGNRLQSLDPNYHKQ